MEILKGMNLSLLNSVDIAVIAIIVISTLFAFIRGLISSVMSLFGWMSSIAITYKFAPQIQHLILGYIKSELIAIAVSYGMTMIISLIGFAILNSLVSKLFGFLQGSFIDRILGALLGLIRGVIIVSFAFLCISFGSNLLIGNSANNEKEDDVIPLLIKNAQTYELLAAGRNILMTFLPNFIDVNLGEFIGNIEGSNVDEKFISSMIRKMYRSMTNNEIDEVEHKTNNTEHFSEKNKELQTATDLLELYKEKKKQNEISNDDEISPAEMKKLENMIGNTTIR